MDNNRSHPLIYLNALIAIGMCLCVFTGALLVELPGGILFPASNIIFGLLTFPLTDIIADVYGIKEAHRTVLIGFFAQVLTWVFISLIILLPGDTQILAPFALKGARVLMGSTVAYFAAQYWDIFIFHSIKEKFTGEKHLWLRNNLSTFSSQVINSSLFILIVFGWEKLWLILPGSILIKWLIALADTPLVYLGCHLVRKEKLRCHSQMPISST